MPALDVPTEDYRKAAAAGAVGVVAGRAVGDPQRPGEPPPSLPDVGVTLVPRSSALLVELDRIRTQARQEPDAFRSSARAVARARQNFERALAEAGTADLVRFTAVEPDGAFVLERIPAGAWVLIAQRAVFVPKLGTAPSRRERESFGSRSHLSGYYAVTIWLRTLSVRPGESESVELTDRNAWMRAIAEERSPEGGR
ncbi:MAG: hypothetical protein ACREK6_13290 [Candidatus Rokuibacteriota bacterium]